MSLGEFLKQSFSIQKGLQIFIAFCIIFMLLGIFGVILSLFKKTGLFKNKLNKFQLNSKKLSIFLFSSIFVAIISFALIIYLNKTLNNYTRQVNDKKEKVISYVFNNDYKELDVYDLKDILKDSPKCKVTIVDGKLKFASMTVGTTKTIITNCNLKYINFKKTNELLEEEKEVTVSGITFKMPVYKWFYSSPNRINDANAGNVSSKDYNYHNYTLDQNNNKLPAYALGDAIYSKDTNTVYVFD